MTCIYDLKRATDDPQTRYRGILHHISHQIRHFRISITTAAATTSASALRGSTNIRGRWGETALQNLLELAGLPKDVAYRLQPTLSAADKRQRPDVIVTLPGCRDTMI